MSIVKIAMTFKNIAYRSSILDLPTALSPTQMIFTDSTSSESAGSEEPAGALGSILDLQKKWFIHINSLCSHCSEDKSLLKIKRKRKDNNIIIIIILDAPQA